MRVLLHSCSGHARQSPQFLSCTTRLVRPAFGRTDTHRLLWCAATRPHLDLEQTSPSLSRGSCSRCVAAAHQPPATGPRPSPGSHPAAVTHPTVPVRPCPVHATPPVST